MHNLLQNVWSDNMLTDDEFVTQSITLNLFYLLNIRCFCLNILLSFLDENCIEEAEKYLVRTENLVNSFINESAGIIPPRILKYRFLVTKYTLDLEYLTEKLFDFELQTEVAASIDKFEEAPPRKIDINLINLMKDVNIKTYKLAKEYKEFLSKIFILEKNNQLFSYNSPRFIKEIIETIEMYIYLLERNIRKLKVNPSFISNYEYRMLILYRSVAKHIGLKTDPSREDVLIKSGAFSIEFNSLAKEYLITDYGPDDLKKLTKKIKKLIKRFADFLAELTVDLLEGKVYFIIEPIFIDVLYRSVNHMIYNLEIIDNNS